MDQAETPLGGDSLQPLVRRFILIPFPDLLGSPKQ
jgi:hypothetical protein